MSPLSITWALLKKDTWRTPDEADAIEEARREEIMRILVQQDQARMAQTPSESTPLPPNIQAEIERLKAAREKLQSETVVDPLAEQQPPTRTVGVTRPWDMAGR